MNKPLPLSAAVSRSTASDAPGQPTAESIFFEIGIVLAATLAFSGAVSFVLTAFGLV